MPGAWSQTLMATSESSAPIEENENDGGSGDGDQGEGGEIGDQVDVDAHGSTALS